MTLFPLPLFRLLFPFLRSLIIFCSPAKRRIISAYLPSLWRIACKLVRDVYDECKRSAQTLFSLKPQLFHKSLQTFVFLSLRNLNQNVCPAWRNQIVPRAEINIERTRELGFVDLHLRKTDNARMPNTNESSLIRTGLHRKKPAIGNGRLILTLRQRNNSGSRRKKHELFFSYAVFLFTILSIAYIFAFW